MHQSEFHDQLHNRIQDGGDFVVVTLVDVHGSTPADAGAKMLVDANGRDFGTVGGGRVEAKAIETAQSMLQSGKRFQFADWSLKADVGMTCGGRVRLYFESWNRTPWQIVVFGAGHVTQALASLLVSMPCQLTCIDPRIDWLDRLPNGARTECVEEPKVKVAELSDDSFVLCMTRGHKSDLPILKEIFHQRRRFPYLGVIGSKAKAAVIRKELIEDGITEDEIQFFCPIGLPIGNNHPSEIAVSIAAQLLGERDRISSRREQDA